MPPTSSTKRCAASATVADDGGDGDAVQYFLLKSEPSEYSIEDMARDVREEWNGIRNYQARNHLRSMKVGDRAFFYHSMSSRPGIVGSVKIARTAMPDPSAFDPQSKYYDAKSTEENCRWDSVLVEYETTFPVMLTLKEMKDAVSNDPGGAIASMALFKQTRLSVVPLTRAQWAEVMTMLRNNGPDEGQTESEEGSKMKKKRIDNSK
jgi:predicted RNA-binding protein with PUA-like domain